MAEPKTLSPVDEALAGREAAEKRIEAVKTATLAEINVKLAELAKLGFTFTLVEGNGGQKRTGRPPGSKNKPAAQ
jgi:hypothetical protein